MLCLTEISLVKATFQEECAYLSGHKILPTVVRYIPSRSFVFDKISGGILEMTNNVECESHSD